MNGIQYKRENMNPANYNAIGWYYTGGSINVLRELDNFSRSECAKGWEWLQDRGFNTDTYQKCSHCGTNHAWGVIYEDVTNGEEFNVGCQCADEFFSHKQKYSYDMAQLKKTIEFENNKREVRKVVCKYIRENLHIWSMMQFDNPFIKDVKYRFLAIGRLSKAQEDAIVKVYNSCTKAQQERTEKNKTALDVPNGRLDIEAEVISVKRTYGFRGAVVPKMLLETKDGYRVFGTIPYELWSSVDELEDIKGKSIALKATLEQSKDDSKFGFFKRPKMIG